MNLPSENEYLFSLVAAGQTIEQLTTVTAALHAGVAGELENAVAETATALERLLWRIREDGEPVSEAMATAAVALRAKAMELHIALGYLAEFQQGWSALIRSQREGYTGEGRAAVTGDPLAVWMEA